MLLGGSSPRAPSKITTPSPRARRSLIPAQHLPPAEAKKKKRQERDPPIVLVLWGQPLPFNLSADFGLAPMMGDGYFGVSGAAGMIFTAGNSNPVINTSGLPQAGGSSGSLLDAEAGLKHDTGLAVEWSVNEQYKLEEGLVRYADEPSIMKYIKIAATLQDKTVRDVALRCRWMTRKRPGKKVNIRKLPESSAKTTSVLPLSVATYPPISDHMDYNDVLHFEGSGTSGSANPKNLLERNNQAFSRIRANLHLLKLQENIDLFCRTRNNITAILNNMRDMPGIMSQMPPLPVSIDEDLASTILPCSAQPMVYGSGGGVPLKQEPRC